MNVKIKGNSVLQTPQFALWHTNRRNWLLKKVVKIDFDMFADLYCIHMPFSISRCLFQTTVNKCVRPQPSQE